ncbi:MAG TPA: hypothetical protein VGR35_17180 [Tepidisphaeraceae bacterium]|nr:hypothetical protein [Tepidisphaeraceae bacterium]
MGLIPDSKVGKIQFFQSKVTPWTDNAVALGTTADPQSVYDLAQIPAPALPTPVTTLGMPANFTATLDQSGALTLKWKCASPRASGTVYQVWRRTTPAGEFTYLGGVGDKKDVDAAIPAGYSQVTYQIQAVRSTAVGPWAQFNVNFGVSTGGAMTASVELAPKMAA